MMVQKKIAKLFFLVLFIACDFTPKVHKKILAAQEKIREQEIDAAIQIYLETLDYHLSEETKIKIYYQLGELYSLYKGEIEKAVVFYKKVIETTQEASWLVKTEEKIGDLNFIHIQNYKESLKSYERLINFRPKLKDIEFYEYRFALSLARLELFDKAKEELEKISQAEEHRFKKQALFDLGTIFFERKDWDKAIEYLQLYTRIETSRDKIAQAKFIIANCLETKEELKKAYNVYYSIINDFPDPQIIEKKLKSIFDRRVARKR
jgi:tetratricopeptide (TPR) repeat protein